MNNLTTLLDRATEQNILSKRLQELYGGSFGLPEPPTNRPWVIVNFVTTLEGITSFALPGQAGGGYISAFNAGDTFIMGLLRAMADAVMVGANTLRTESEHLWTHDYIAPAFANDFAEMRNSLGKNRRYPLNMFVTGSGKVLTADTTKTEHLPAAFRTEHVEPWIVTTVPGKRNISSEFSSLPTPQIVVAGIDRVVDLKAMMRHLRQEMNVKHLLIEGGASFNGAVVHAGLYDELFLTRAPQIIGTSKEKPRPMFIEGVNRTPETAIWHDLMSVKEADNYLYERYRRRN